VIAAVLFDLDDTLYPQASWLHGAWEAVADAAPDTVDRAAFLAALYLIAGQGSDQGRIIDRALARIDACGTETAPLISAFRHHAPARLEPYPEAVDVVAAVRERVPVGLVSDGDVDVQAAKVRALGFEQAFDVVVLSDAMGREHRKPDSGPFLAAAERLGVVAQSCVMVGDRPDKDVRGARQAGLLGAVRVRTGEYAAEPDEDGCLVTLDTLGEAGRWLLARLDAHGPPAPGARASSTWLRPR